MPCSTQYIYTGLGTFGGPKEGPRWATEAQRGTRGPEAKTKEKKKGKKKEKKIGNNSCKSPTNRVSKSFARDLDCSDKMDDESAYSI